MDRLQFVVVRLSWNGMMRVDEIAAESRLEEGLVRSVLNAVYNCRVTISQYGQDRGY